MRRAVYLSWPAEEITGGIKLVFRHVEMLKACGLNAVVATQTGTRPTWFDTDCEMINFSQIDSTEDVLVFPENHEAMLQQFSNVACRKIVFCQNQFMAYRGLGGRACYSDFGVSGILSSGRTVSHFSRKRFPKIPCFELPVMVDINLFKMRNTKKMQIAFAPRKRNVEAMFIYDFVRAIYPQSKKLQWVKIHGLPESQVAEILRDSAIYLSLQRLESVGMSSLEAMACGCIVAGFTGIGGREYSTDANGFWAPEDDCETCAHKLAQAVELVSSGSVSYADMVSSGRFTASQYLPERLQQRLIGFWTSILENDEWPK